MKVAIYPGSFDPLTNGHMDIIERSARMTDKLIVAILHNTNKNYWLSEDERVSMLEAATSHLDNVEVEVFGGLLVDFAMAKQARTIIRGLRMVSDFENEMAMAGMNRSLAPEIETVFLMTSSRCLYLSSSLIKEVLKLGGKIDDMIPKAAVDIVKRRICLIDEGEAGL